ncbi:MAG: ATP-dependent Clp protease adaptor ClpS [Bryobacterales bacterium]
MSSAVVMPDLEEEVFEDTLDEEGKFYHVILLNDEDHTYDYVIEMLMEIFDFTEDKAYQHTVEVDTKGHSRLVTLPLAQAEAKRDAVHAYGADWRLPRSLGAMAALIEPAD